MSVMTPLVPLSHYNQPILAAQRKASGNPRANLSQPGHAAVKLILKSLQILAEMGLEVGETRVFVIRR